MVGWQALLFVPANRPDRFAKAAASGADAVILDLEDAVAAKDKEHARSCLADLSLHCPVLVRVNAVGTPWHVADIAALHGLQVAAVMLPKAEDAETVEAIAAGNLPVIALIETARGLAEARRIAALPNVARLAFGSVDYSLDLGLEHQREILLPARSELVLASRLAGIAAPLDGVTTQIDATVATDDARHARAIGMAGKLCIHPLQVRGVREAFLPSAAEIKWARTVLESGDGAASVDGEMVDEPVRRRARNILDRTPAAKPEQ